MAKGPKKVIPKAKRKVALTKKNITNRRDTRETTRSVARPVTRDQAAAKGANTYGRTALGRGLSVLLSPSAVNIRPKQATEFQPTPAPVSNEIPFRPAPTPVALVVEEEIELDVDELEDDIEEVDADDSDDEESEPSDLELDGAEDETPESVTLEAYTEARLEEAADEAEEGIVGSPFQQPVADLPATITLAPLEGVEGAVNYVPIERVVTSAIQPRKHFAENDLESLAQSIRSTGLLQPLIVRRTGAGGPLEIVAGERRWRAAQRAGLDRIPVIIRDLTDREALGAAIVENVQRADLNPIEEAESYARLISEFNETQESVSEVVGKDRATVANVLRLLRLPPPIRSLLAEGKLSAGHGRALLMIDDSVRQLALAEQSIREGLSVRALERLSAEASPQRAKRRVTKQATSSIDVLAVEERLRRGLGTKVGIAMSSGEKGEIKISFYSQAELERLLDHIAP